MYILASFIPLIIIIFWKSISELDIDKNSWLFAFLIKILGWFLGFVGQMSFILFLYTQDIYLIFFILSDIFSLN